MSSFASEKPHFVFSSVCGIIFSFLWHGAVYVGRMHLKPLFEKPGFKTAKPLTYTYFFKSWTVLVGWCRVDKLSGWIHDGKKRQYEFPGKALAFFLYQKNSDHQDKHFFFLFISKRILLHKVTNQMRICLAQLIENVLRIVSVEWIIPVKCFLWRDVEDEARNPD